MPDFNLPNLMTWKKDIDFSFESLMRNKKKTFLILLLILFPLLTVSVTAIRVNSLQNEKRRHEMELSILRQSELHANKQLGDDREKIRKLSNRVDNIITNGNDDYSVLGSTVKVESQANSNINTEQKINPSLVVSVSPSKISSKGKIEVYDPSRKIVDVFYEATTISKVVGQVKVGENVEYFQKNSGWYQIKFEDSMAWINEKNVRVLSE